MRILVILLCLGFPAIFAIAGDSAAGTLAVDGGSLNYETAGEGEAVIFLHGGFGDMRMWESQWAEFQKNYRVIRYDQRGFGKSSIPNAAYSPVQDLVRLMDHLGIDRAHLVGNSMGGSLALDFAIEKPDRVFSVAVVASGASGFPVPQEDRDRMNAVFRTAAEEGVEQAAGMWLENPMVSVTHRNPETADLLKQMVMENARILRMQFWPIEPMNPPAYKRLQEIKIPTLLITGDKDTPAVLDIAEKTAHGIPGAKKVVLQGADHLPQMTHPAQFNKNLKDFLASHKGETSEP